MRNCKPPYVVFLGLTDVKESIAEEQLNNRHYRVLSRISYEKEDLATPPDRVTASRRRPTLSYYYCATVFKPIYLDVRLYYSFWTPPALLYIQSQINSVDTAD